MAAFLGSPLLPQPRFVFFLRIAQVLLVLITLALVSNTMHAFQAFTIFGGSLADAFPEVTFIIALCVMSILAFIYILVIPNFMPHFYGHFIHLGVEAVITLFWFCGFCALASWTSKNKPAPQIQISLTSSLFGRGQEEGELFKREPKGGKGSSLGGNRSSSDDSVSGGVEGWWITSAVACATAAILWVLFSITLAKFILAWRNFQSNPENAAASGAGLEKGNEMGAVYQQPSVPLPAQTMGGGEYYGQPGPTSTTPAPGYNTVSPTPPPGAQYGGGQGHGGQAVYGQS